MVKVSFKIIIATFIILNISILTSANATASDAQEFIKKISNKVIHLIEDEDVNELMKKKQLSKIFEESVDTKWISKFVMGKHWRDTSDLQKKVYLELHRKFLINSYVPKFRNYANQKVRFKKFYDEGNNEYLIETEIVQTDGTAIEVDYKVRKNKNNEYKIFDVIAEGVSLITTQRSEFASILSRKGVDYLIKRLKAKV